MAPSPGLRDLRGPPATRAPNYRNCSNSPSAAHSVRTASVLGPSAVSLSTHRPPSARPIGCPWTHMQPDCFAHVCSLRLGGGDLFTADVKSPLQGEWPGRGCCLAPAPRSDGASGGDSVRLHLGPVPGTPRTAGERRLPCRRARNVRWGAGRPSEGRVGRRADDRRRTVPPSRVAGPAGRPPGPVE